MTPMRSPRGNLCGDLREPPFPKKTSMTPIPLREHRARQPEFSRLAGRLLAVGYGFSNGLSMREGTDVNLALVWAIPWEERDKKENVPSLVMWPLVPPQLNLKLPRQEEMLRKGEFSP